MNMSQTQTNLNDQVAANAVSCEPVQPVTLRQSREVELTTAGIPTADGAGVKLTRVLTDRFQRRLDPFLMLDNFRSDNPDDYIAGFPNHPHRGFETVTYMIAGQMLHRDSAGNEGLLQDGDVQWMSAAKGVIHSEIPQQKDGVMEGFQLWLNLPASAKMNDPWYQDVSSAALPKYQTADGVLVTVIAGTSNGVAGAITREVTEPTYLDVDLPAGTRFSHAIDASHNAFVFVYRGTVRIGATSVPLNHMAVLANDAMADGVSIEATTDSKVLVISGRPLNEPIVQYGPFVMNTEQEIYQAVRDFQAGKFGQSA